MLLSLFFFFFNDTATTEIYTLSLHDALPIFVLTVVIVGGGPTGVEMAGATVELFHHMLVHEDRKSTRLNSSHEWISYAVFCLKKKKREARTRLPSCPHNPSSE